MQYEKNFNEKEKNQLKDDNSILQSQLQEFNYTLKDFHSSAEIQSSKLTNTLHDKEMLSSQLNFVNKEMSVLKEQNKKISDES